MYFIVQKHLKTPDIVIGADTVVVSRVSCYTVSDLSESYNLSPFFLHSRNVSSFLHPQTVDGQILEKPSDKQDAYRMLSRLFYHVLLACCI